MRLILPAILLLQSVCLKAQDKHNRENSPLLMQLFGNSSPAFFDVISQPETYRYQIIYTKINRTSKGRAALENHYFNCGEPRYLYPASLVKLPLCALALEKCKSLGKYGVTLNSPMLTDTADYCQTPAWRDSTQPGYYATLDGYLKKMMLVSDNDAYNRVYEFLGYDYIAKTLKDRGFEDVRIVQRFLPPCDDFSYLATNPVYFLRGNDTCYKQPAAVAENRYHNPMGEVFMGSQYYDASGFLFPFPRSFYYNNHLSLEDAHRVLMNLFFGSNLPSAKRFDAVDSNLLQLKKYMGMWPKECSNPQYMLPDNFKKYLLIGDGSSLPSKSDIRIFNVVGRAYGVLADVAYIVDFKNDVEFMLSCQMYCNADNVLNDDSYEYYQVGLPFMSELGKLIYNYELQRKRKNTYHDKVLESLYQKGN